VKSAGKWHAGLQRVTHLPIAAKEKYVHVVPKMCRWKQTRIVSLTNP
jgi:hypothetical protein